GERQRGEEKRNNLGRWLAHRLPPRGTIVNTTAGGSARSKQSNCRRKTAWNRRNRADPGLQIGFQRGRRCHQPGTAGELVRGVATTVGKRPVMGRVGVGLATAASARARCSQYHASPFPLGSSRRTLPPASATRSRSAPAFSGPSSLLGPVTRP